MSIKRLHRIQRSFRTSDGTEFGMLSEARAWEAELAVREWVRNNVAEKPFTINDFARILIDGWPDLRKLLSKTFLDGPAKSIGVPAIEETEGNDNVQANRPKRKRKEKSNAQA
jgi:hypothetical protein